MKKTSDLSQEQCFWLYLSAIPRMGPAGLARLYQYFDTITDILLLPEAQVQAFGLDSDHIERLRALAATDSQFVALLDWLAVPEHQLISIESTLYPPQLREIPDPPVLLYVKGDPEVLHFPQLGVIGSRKASAQGLKTAYEFSLTLSEQGLIPTSGLALGVDARGHQGGLDGKGLTIGVLGTGIDQLYPRANTALAEAIIASGGALVSEYPLGTAPMAYNFPRRNRIISGLSLGCLVVEASVKSGSLITARMAMEQGREVFAIPGSIHNPMSRGCHQLIREGAVLVDAVDQVYEQIAQQLSLPVFSTPADQHETRVVVSNKEALILEAIGHEFSSFDELMAQTGLLIHELSSLLLELELKGLLQQHNGSYQRLF